MGYLRRRANQRDATAQHYSTKLSPAEVFQVAEGLVEEFPEKRGILSSGRRFFFEAVNSQRALVAYGIRLKSGKLQLAWTMALSAGDMASAPGGHTFAVELVKWKTLNDSIYSKAEWQRYCSLLISRIAARDPHMSEWEPLRRS